MSRNTFSLELYRNGKLLETREGLNSSSILAAIEALSPLGSRERGLSHLSNLSRVALTTIDLEGKEAARALGDGFPGYSVTSPGGSSATLGEATSRIEETSEVEVDGDGSPLRIIYKRKWEVPITKDGTVLSALLQRTSATIATGGGVHHSVSVSPLDVWNGDSVVFSHKAEVDVEGLEFPDPELPWLRELGDLLVRGRILDVDGNETGTFDSEVKVFYPSTCFSASPDASDSLKVSSDGARRSFPLLSSGTNSTSGFSFYVTGEGWVRGDNFRAGSRLYIQGTPAATVKLTEEELPLGDSFNNLIRSPSVFTTVNLFAPAGGSDDSEISAIYIPFVGAVGSFATVPLGLDSPEVLLSRPQGDPSSFPNSSYLSLVTFDPPISVTKEESFSFKIVANASVGIPDSVQAEFPLAEVRRSTPPEGYVLQEIQGLGGEPLGREKWVGNFSFPTSNRAFSGYSIQAERVSTVPMPGSSMFRETLPPSWRGKGFFASLIFSKANASAYTSIKLSINFYDQEGGLLVENKFLEGPYQRPSSGFVRDSGYIFLEGEAPENAASFGVEFFSASTNNNHTASIQNLELWIEGD